MQPEHGYEHEYGPTPQWHDTAQSQQRYGSQPPRPRRARRPRRTVLFIVLGVVVAVCGIGILFAALKEDTDTFDAAKCTPMSTEDLARIAEGLSDPTVTLIAGAYYPLPDAERTANIASIAVVKASDGVVLPLATADKSLGPILAIGDSSRSYFDWGSAATEGSRAHQMIDALYNSDARRYAERCLTATE